MDIIKNAVLILCTFCGGISLFSLLLSGGIALKLKMVDDDFIKRITLVSLMVLIASALIALITFFML